MELLIALLIGASVTVALATFIQIRTDAHLATQMRLERVAGRISDEWAVPVASPLRTSRLSNIAWVERLLNDLDLAKTVDLALVRADWSLRVSEFLGIIALSGASGLALVAFITGNFLFGIPAMLVCGALPVLVLRIAVGRRRGRLEKQLIEALVMISNSLKAGFGLMQAIDQAAKQLPDPLSKELRQTLRDTQIGSSIEEAITSLGVRVGSYDLEIVVTAILVQRNVGGNLSEILESVAHTMRERDRIRGEIKTLTSQQRLTGIVIAALPIGLAVLFSFMNPEYMALLYTTSLGKMMVGGALVLELFGGFIIKRIIAIEV